MKLLSVEGNTQKLDGGAMFGNAPKAMWSSWCPPDDKNRILLACRSMLVITETANPRIILFEAGTGIFFEPKLRERFGIVEQWHVLVENLKALDISPGSVTDIILSHLHFDHAGGILTAFEDGPLNLIFPNANYYVSKVQWERACKPHPRDKASYVPAMISLLKDSGKLRLVEENFLTIDELTVSFVNSDGHTPGMMLSKIHTEQGPILFGADLIPGIFWINPSITMGYDRYPELVIEEKLNVLKDLETAGGYLFFTHDPKYPIAKISKNTEGKFIGTPANVDDFKFS